MFAALKLAQRLKLKNYKCYLTLEEIVSCLRGDVVDFLLVLGPLLLVTEAEVTVSSASLEFLARRWRGAAG